MLIEDALHITRWGAGASVLMIHGGPQGGPAGGAILWSAQRPLAEDGWLLVVPDRPGHGRSPSRGPEEIEREATWVAELLAQERSHLVGHSYGACIALQAAGMAPERVRSLTLIEAPAYSVAIDDPAVAAARDELEAALQADVSARERFLAFARLAGIPHEMAAGNDEETQARMGEGLAVMRPPFRWDPAPAVESVAQAGIPLLVVTGGWSPSMEAIAQRLAARVGGEHEVIPSGHHLPQLHPAFNERLRCFLAAAESRR